MNVSSRANSFAESWISVSPRQTCRVAGSSRRSPTSSDGRAARPPAPGERAQARQQLGERERLRQVVVGAGVEPGDAILDRVARGQHQHRRPDAALPQPAADLDAVDAGQHQVEHDRVVLDRLGHPERVVAGPGDVGGVALLDQAPAEQARHLELVLDDQDPHRTSIVRAEMRV